MGRSFLSYCDTSSRVRPPPRRVTPAQGHGHSGGAAAHVGSAPVFSGPRGLEPHPVAPPLAPAHSAHRYGREGPSEWVDEQRDGPGLRGYRSLEGLDGVGKMAVLQTRLLDHDDRVFWRFITRLQ